MNSTFTSPVAGILFTICGGMLAANVLCLVRRVLGVLCLVIGAFLLITPAMAQDQNLVAANDGEVQCLVSSKGLTRISLRDDRFVSMSKLSTGIESEEFSAVHEPNRGDLYISIPAGYALQDVSFFATSAKGYVYKFACRLQPLGAHQVFLTNKETVQNAPVEVARRSSPASASVQLIQAMYDSSPIEGFTVAQPDLKEHRFGPLAVRMTAEYRGLDYVGRVLRLENKGRDAIPIDDRTLAPRSAIAVSVSTKELKSGEATTAFVVLPAGEAP